MKQRKNTPHRRKGTAVVATLALLLCLAVGGTLAWLSAFTEPVVNTFQPASISTEVEETVSNREKSEIKVKNTGDIDAYIRVAIVMNWVNGTEIVSGELPALPSVLGQNWIKQGDYYYYTVPVASGRETGVLFSQAIKEENAPDGCHLQVTILAEAVQSVPKDAVEEAWGTAIANQLT